MALTEKDKEYLIKEVQRCYREGHLDGYREGRKEGYATGYTSGMQAGIQMFMRLIASSKTCPPAWLQ